jgi:hypothetical protein
MRLITAASAACLFALTLAAPEDVYAQKGRPVAATGAFRCTAGVPDDTCPPVQDNVRDDGAAYAFLLASGEGSQLNTNGEYYLWFQTGGADRRLTVDLSDQIEAGGCEPNCYYQQAWGTLPEIHIYDGWLRTNVVDSAGNEVKGGLMAIPCDSLPHDSRMLITFTNATQTSSTKTVSMTLRWYADAFPPSNMVQVTRHNRTTFTIEAPEGSAQAVLNGSAIVRGKLQNTRLEGVFDMPFKLQVTVPAAPAKDGCLE